MKMRSKKGTTMVEAAMIFPLVIAGIVAVIYIVINLYLSLSLQSSLHLALRKECGEMSHTVHRIEEIPKFDYKKERVGLRPILCMEEERAYQISTLFEEHGKRRETGRSYLINEAEMIRIFHFSREEP